MRSRGRRCRRCPDAANVRVQAVWRRPADPAPNAQGERLLLAAPGALVGAGAVDPVDPQRLWAHRARRRGPGRRRSVEHKDADATSSAASGVINTGTTRRRIHRIGGAGRRSWGPPMPRASTHPIPMSSPAPRRSSARQRWCWWPTRRRPEGANDPGNWPSSSARGSCARPKALCLQGAHLADPARVDQRGTVKVGMDVRNDVDVIFEGDVELGDGGDPPVHPLARRAPGRRHAECARIATWTASSPRARPRSAPLRVRLRLGIQHLPMACTCGNFVETRGRRIGLGTRPIT